MAQKHRNFRATVEEIEDEEDIRMQREFDSRKLNDSDGSLLINISDNLEEPMVPREGGNADKETINQTKQKIHKASAHKTKLSGKKMLTDNSMYCQPTSSKVKIEHLVDDNTEQTILQELNTEINSSNAVNQPRRSFWERPVPNPQLDWIYDPRMPQEMNELMIDAMRHQTAKHQLNKSVYRQAFPEEISEPVDFKTIYSKTIKDRKTDINRLNESFNSVEKIHQYRKQVEKSHKPPEFPKDGKQKINKIYIRATRDEKGKQRELPDPQELQKLRDK